MVTIGITIDNDAPELTNSVRIGLKIKSGVTFQKLNSYKKRRNINIGFDQYITRDRLKSAGVTLTLYYKKNNNGMIVE